MSSNLPVTAGGGAVVSLPAGDVIPAAQHDGEVYLDRGGNVRSTAQGLHGEVQRAAGVALSRDQIQRVQQVLVRHRAAQDQLDRGIAEKAIKASWGIATEGNLIRIHEWLSNTIGREAADEILGARDDAGTGICNKPSVLEGLLKATNAAPALRSAENRPSSYAAPDSKAISSARLREIELLLRTGDARYFKDDAVQSEYRDLLSRGVTGDIPGRVGDSEINARIKEIDRWMGSPKGSVEYRRYWDYPAVQREYAELLERRQRAR